MYGTLTGRLFLPIRTSNPPAHISQRIAGLAGSCKNHFDFQEDGHRESLVYCTQPNAMWEKRCNATWIALF